MAGNKLGAEKAAATRIGVSHDTYRLNLRAGMNWCTECKSWKHGDQFYADNTRPTKKATVCKPCAKLRVLRCRYKLTRGDLQALQDSRCQICQRTGQKMEVDHCHHTGKVRAFLCSRCNGALGQFCDDVRLLKSAIEYLERHDG